MSQRAAEKLRRELDGVKGRRGPCFPRDLKERTGAWLAERSECTPLADGLQSGGRRVRRKPYTSGV